MSTASTFPRGLGVLLRRFGPAFVAGQDRPASSGPRHARDDCRALVLIGTAIVALVFGGFGAWSALAPLASAVVAPGSIVVDTNRKQIQHLEGGTVKDILVHDGDRVRAGQVLVRLDDTLPRAHLAILQAEYDLARASEARLEAERTSAPTVTFPPELLARAEQPNVQELLKGQTALFLARRATLHGQVDILNQRISQLKEEIKGIEAQNRATATELSLKREQLSAQEYLFRRGNARKPEILALRGDVARLDGERGAHLSAIAQTERAIGEARLQILQRSHSFDEQVSTELRDAHKRIFDIGERLHAAQDVLNHIDIRAPESGYVVGMRVHTVGGVVRPGETLLELVPDKDRLIVEAHVAPDDVDNLSPGQQVEVQLTAFQARRTPVVLGTVSSVSADVLADPATHRDYYALRVTVPKSELARLDDKQLRPGMPAMVMVKTGNRTVLEYLLEPILDTIRYSWREQ
jgi:HlyD family secretion protein/epimerase transport system membrane fusion protein